MKIAYLANIRFPSERAHAVQITHMCNAFCENGAEVDLFVSKRQFEGSVESTFEINPEFEVIRILPNNIYPKFKFTFYIGELLFALGFLFGTKKIEYEIIYSRSEWVLYFLSFAVTSKKIIWESHEAKFNIAAKRLLNKKVRTVAISKGIKDFYLKKNIPSEQVLIADDGIDESFFGDISSKNESRNKLGLDLNSFVVMYVGGFDEWKGIETFFAAAKLIPEVNFVAIGGSKNQIKSLSEKFPKVTFLGSLPYNELRDNQQAADILVIPNTGKNELSNSYTSPLKLFAHMTSGVPILASNIPSLNNVLSTVQATFFRADSFEDLSAGINEIKNNHQLKLAHAKELKLVSRKYTWNNRAKLILGFRL